jgi:hypothetical protein
MTRAGGRWTIALLVLAGVLLVAGANAHLLYAALTSQPDCVAHVRQGDVNARPGQFAVAKSAC